MRLGVRLAIGFLISLKIMVLGGSGCHQNKMFDPIRLQRLPADVYWLQANLPTSTVPVLVIRFEQPIAFEALLASDVAAMAHAPDSDITDWAQETQAPIVFNGGQYDTSGRYLGWLKSKGVWINKVRHATWKGLLTSDVHRGVRIFDLKHSGLPSDESVETMAQTMMLFGASSNLRVKRTHKRAARVVLGEDRTGGIFLIASHGRVGLAEFGAWLMEREDLKLVKAINLDGGNEAQIAIRDPALHLDFFGQSSWLLSWASFLGLYQPSGLPYVFTFKPLD